MNLKKSTTVRNTSRKNYYYIPDILKVCVITSMDLLSSKNSDFQLKVSSVLNRNVKEFGKKFLYDGREDTCWNSEQGSPQSVQIRFDTKKTVGEIQLMLQGGFVGKNCSVQFIKDDSCSFEKVLDFSPEDANKLQKFIFDQPVSGIEFKIIFEDSTDFFGRITLYQLKLISPSSS